jgi:N-acetylglucosaminyldiphosphoundecaprenol N-acetyl-beta-D-mannosaminyltransferase
VFGDGTGVRWAARMKGTRLRDNLCGTDLIPALFESTPGYRYFLLGADEPTIERAAARAQMRFPNWTLAGFHHGYVKSPELSEQVIGEVNAARADVLLVGMGNPRQERWLEAHRDRLRVPLGIGVGGLFDFWAETVSRAPAWVRRIGYDWVWRLMQQPRDKARRYLIGNPAFLLRAVRDAWA